MGWVTLNGSASLIREVADALYAGAPELNGESIAFVSPVELDTPAAGPNAWLSGESIPLAASPLILLALVALVAVEGPCSEPTPRLVCKFFFAISAFRTEP